jgi:hydroxymethylpyrimidine/phosphomethylpyrimidine kinase
VTVSAKTASTPASVPDVRPPSPPTVLAIAGYDPSAGAGVLADLKTLAAHGVYGMACVTALTVQSTRGVCRVQGVDASIVTETLDCLAQDVRFSAIKVGMLGIGSVAAAVADWLGRNGGIPVILDPVLKSSSGKDLLAPEGFEALRARLLSRADWLTPNWEELASLTDNPRPNGRGEVERLGRLLLAAAARRGNHHLKLAITGGDAESPDDLLLSEEACRWFVGEHIKTTSTHGTGCAFSSALAARIALGDDPVAAVSAAKQYVAGALRSARPIGKGRGPLDHFWRFNATRNPAGASD